MRAQSIRNKIRRPLLSRMTVSPNLMLILADALAHDETIDEEETEEREPDAILEEIEIEEREEERRQSVRSGSMSQRSGDTDGFRVRYLFHY